MTKTTKYVSITEWDVFAVRNNYQVIATTKNWKEAGKIACEIARKENKKIKINYLFGEIKMTCTPEQMENLINAFKETDS